MSFDLNLSPLLESEDSEESEEVQLKVDSNKESLSPIYVDELSDEELNCKENNQYLSTDCADVVRSNFSGIAAEIEERLEVGSVVEDIDQVYALYCEYARCSGFSVRKGCQRYFHNSWHLRMKMFCCSCEGAKDNKRSIRRRPAYKRQDIRSHCKARIRVVRDRIDGPWKVSVFYKNHNHDLLDMDQTYLLRSARRVTNSKRCVLDALIGAGIPVSRACKFMELESKGLENVGFTRKDAYNHKERMKSVTRIKNGDAKALMDLFTEKSVKEPFFYYKVQLDDRGRMLNFFFRDSRSAVDYDYFGDVVSFDTTYKTNKYNMVCAPFIGINHHFQNIMFGLGFLSDETTSSFRWLFKAFLESMFGKEPAVVYTDQCQALKNGLEHTFESTTHRFCQWHINQNAPSHFGSLNSDKMFKRKWQHCMNGCETVEEFEEIWTEMMNAYGLGKKKWFRSMYNLRRKWSSVFTNEEFSAGLHATSRSEVTNRILKDLGHRSDSLFEFVKHFMEVQDDWRVRERAEDANCRGMPGLIIEGNRLLTHIGGVFTRTIYHLFEVEATESMNNELVHHPSDYFRNDLFFGVREGPNSRIRSVFFNRVTMETSCSCRMWETKGILCSHIFKVYYLLNVSRVPEQYILRRWRRDCKDRWAPSSTVRETSAIDTDCNEILYVNHMIRMVYDMLYELKDNFSTRTDFLDDMIKIRSKYFPLGLCNEANGKEDGRADEEGFIRNPAMAKTRGVHVGKSWGKTKKRRVTAQEPNNEMLHYEEKML